MPHVPALMVTNHHHQAPSADFLPSDNHFFVSTVFRNCTFKYNLESSNKKCSNLCPESESEHCSVQTHLFPYNFLINSQTRTIHHVLGTINKINSGRFWWLSVLLKWKFLAHSCITLIYWSGSELQVVGNKQPTESLRSLSFSFL